MQSETARVLATECAQEVLDVVPTIMRVIRRELRRHGAKEMSVPHFRTLAFLYRNGGVSLSEVAEHIGLTLPTMSTLVDGLVARGLVSRKVDHDDRRRITLTLTELGRSRLASARAATLAHLEEILQQLSSSDRTTIARSMRILGTLLQREG